MSNSNVIFKTPAFKTNSSGGGGGGTATVLPPIPVNNSKTISKAEFPRVFLINASAGAVEINLPPAAEVADQRAEFKIVNLDNSVRILSTEKIDGENEFEFFNEKESVAVFSDGNTFYLIS